MTRLPAEYRMSGYDKQYQVENALFGKPYPEFEAFIADFGHRGGKALDLGCGQGRDALMLAAFGYSVVGVDASRVGVRQMIDRAQAKNLPVDGVVADIFEYKPAGAFDAIVMNSILHFTPAEREKEITLLDKAASYLNQNGYLFIFIHKSSKKEKAFHKWRQGVSSELTLIKEGYIDYVYEEKSKGFCTAFQYYMAILQRM